MLVIEISLYYDARSKKNIKLILNVPLPDTTLRNKRFSAHVF